MMMQKARNMSMMDSMYMTIALQQKARRESLTQAAESFQNDAQPLPQNIKQPQNVIKMPPNTPRTSSLVIMGEAGSSPSISLPTSGGGGGACGRKGGGGGVPSSPPPPPPVDESTIFAWIAFDFVWGEEAVGVGATGAATAGGFCFCVATCFGAPICCGGCGVDGSDVAMGHKKN
jgi:hypothetical protein